MKGLNCLAFTVLAVMGSHVFAMEQGLTALTDTELSAETGQALFNMSYIAPGGTNPSADVGFYKVSMEAQLDLNLNIRKFQLGCGGFKGVGCDVDIDNLSFTGIVPTREKAGSTDAGPLSDFTLINPFYDIAIKNPTSAATREVVGFRIGADSIWGMLSMGDPGSDPGSVSSHTGVNSITGHLPSYIENGKIPVRLCLGGANATNTACNIGNGIDLGYATVNRDTPNPGDNFFDLTLNRASRAYLEGLRVRTQLLGFDVDLTSNLDESLKFIHNMTLGTDVNGNGKYDPGVDTVSKNFGISVQGQDVQWNTNGQWLNAQKGWWMELPESKIGDFTTRTVYAGPTALTGLTLSDLNLNQSPVDNCYGNLTFC